MMFTCFFLHSMSHLQNVIDHHRSSCSPLEQKHGSPHRPLQTSRVVPPLQCKPWWKRYVFVLPDMKCMRTGERLNLNWSQFILMTQFIIFILYILCFLLFLIWSLQVYFVVTCIFKAVRSHFFFTTDQMTNEERQPSSTLRTNHFNPKRLRDKEWDWMAQTSNRRIQLRISPEKSRDFFEPPIFDEKKMMATNGKACIQLAHPASPAKPAAQVHSPSASCVWKKIAHLGRCMENI